LVLYVEFPRFETMPSSFSLLFVKLGMESTSQRKRV